MMSATMQGRVVVLLSGGIDSVTALYAAHRGCEIAAALSFDYGAKHNPCEIDCARWHAAHLGVAHLIVPLQFIGEHFESHLLKRGGAIPSGHYEDASMRQTVGPFRNGIMLSIAAGFAESCQSSGVVIAAHAGDHAIYPDCRADFMDAMARAVALGTYGQIRIWRPFIALTKAEIVKCGAEMGVDFSRTWSCYAGGKTHCGVCGTCVERREAFLISGIPDPTTYASAKPLPPKPVMAS
ncbi:MAG TPA: 7-cyano-7-deazaguanine synthase QueC [Chthoniobacteraceae bacterium]|nr:7-cyano-7-deazaguanine synthase QueC [Chthoniobacteraceae bacterium]